jgi:hypothetical protein
MPNALQEIRFIVRRLTLRPGSTAVIVERRLASIRSPRSERRRPAQGSRFWALGADIA